VALRLQRLSEEVAVLLRHEIPDPAAGQDLRGELIGVEGRRPRPSHVAAGIGDGGMGLKCGNASTRRSQPSIDALLAERNAAFRGMRDIGIARKVGDDGMLHREKMTNPQMVVHEGEEHCGDLLCTREITRKSGRARDGRPRSGLQACDRPRRA
jgi:hypothetical protein